MQRNGAITKSNMAMDEKATSTGLPAPHYSGRCALAITSKLALLSVYAYICNTMEVYDDRYNNRTVYIERRTNGLGTAGFVLAVLTIVLGWVPVFGWFTWALGLIFSFIGMFKAPRGLAIAGFIISLLGLIMILFVFALIAAAIGVAGVSSGIVATII